MNVKSIRFKRILFSAALTITAVTVIIILIAINSKPLEPCLAIIDGISPTVIIDAGHGGLDGGAVSSNGIKESDINLLISSKTRDIMKMFGISSIMTRSDETSLDYDVNKSIRENKNADLKARLKIASNNPECSFLSIHLNKFEQIKYSGAQVFYGKANPESVLLAECIQEIFTSYLDPNNKREAKECHDSIYLMKNINSPAVTIECGFLSNTDEEKLLCDDRYQTHIALSIVKGYIEYIKER